MVEAKRQEEPTVRKLIIYAMLLAAALLIPKNTVELGKLKPVEAILLYIEEGQIVIETDTEDMGRGETVSEALNNLRETTAGIVFLDTADYLLVCDGAQEYISQVARYVKETVLVCEAARTIDLQKSAPFLAVHRPKMQLKKWSEAVQMEVLEEQNGRLILKEKK